MVKYSETSDPGPLSNRWLGQKFLLFFKDFLGPELVGPRLGVLL